MRTRSALLAAAVIAAVAAGGTSAAAAPPSAREAHAPASASAQDATAATYTAVSPVRVLDTRLSGGSLGAGGVRTVDLSGQVPVDATAVVLNVTGTAPTAATFVSVYPGGGVRSEASNLNLVPGQTRPNAVTVALGTGRTINLFNHQGSTHLVVDLVGYYATVGGVGFNPRYPERVLDTRISPGAVGPGGVVTIDLSSRVPTGTTAVTFNLTGVDATAATFVTAWTAGLARPITSSLNLVPGETNPNQVTVQVGPDRRVSLYNNAGFVHLIADVAGFYAPGGYAFYQYEPTRVYDSRLDPAGGWYGGDLFTLGFDNVVPPSAEALVFNLTGTNTTSFTFVSAWPSDQPRTISSNLNLSPGQTAPNLVTVATGPNEFSSQGVDVYNNAGYVDLIFDLAGYFGP